MKQPTVRIGILANSKIHFELRGKFCLLETAQKISGKLLATCSTNSIELFAHEQKLCSLPSLNFAPLDYSQGNFVLFGVTIGIRFHWQRMQHQCFQGNLQFILDDDCIVAINSILLEDYLASVISSEMNAAASLEFLKAHAVISRSWLLAQLINERQAANSQREYRQNQGEFIKWYDREQHSCYDVCADDHCQRYQGIGLSSEQSKRAVTETCGIVLCSKGEVCDARFSKCCGGITESFENVWQPLKRCYLQKVIDSKELKGYDLNLKREKAAKRWIESCPPTFCNGENKNTISQALNDYDRGTSHFYRWKIDYCQEELAALIASNTGIDFGNIFDLRAVERGESGRLVRLKIIGSKANLIIGKELEIRRTLSSSHLYSSAFTVEKSTMIGSIPQKFVFRGAGWGHGVGLCQIGAAAMGAQGHSWEAILMHYFQDTHLETKYLAQASLNSDKC